jgi:hypothetical protein
VETDFRRPFSINVWCGVIDVMLIGPVILDGRVTGHNYLDCVRSKLPEYLKDAP